MRGDKYQKRQYVVAGIFVAFGLLLLARMFYVQVLDERYQGLADNAVIREIISYPARGLIYDRNQKLVVQNQPMYDIMVVPRDVKNIDTSRFCQMFKITESDFVAKMKKAKKYSRYKSSTFLTQITTEEFAQIQEYLYLFQGFYPSVRTIRKYPYNNAPHAIGFLGEVNNENLKNDNYYNGGDYIGKTGIERFYEKELRGIKGRRLVTVDVLNREQGAYKNGEDDIAAQVGEDLYLTLDIDLQRYGEALMQNKKGSVVAIEPNTGEILSMVSSPYYNPNLLSGRERGTNYNLLQKDTLKPLLNRPLNAIYPPGSTLKPVVALIGLEEKAVYVNTDFFCPGYYQLTARRRLRCSHKHDPCYNIKDAIKESCNPYFWTAFNKTIESPKYENSGDAFDKWMSYIKSFGIGVPLNMDLPGNTKGKIPNRAYYDKIYGSGSWAASTIISLGIGQGEFSLTPLQMAMFTGVIAARGKYHYPHLVKSVGNKGKKEIYTQTQFADINPKYFQPVIDGMQETVLDGTAKIAIVEGIDICGKTGTAQNPHGDDHSMFVAFAPKNDPKIAIAVVVENGGYGSRYAAPIASLMIEQYLNDTISTKRQWIEDRMLEADLLSGE